MAKFHRNEKGIGYLKINFVELIEYSRNPQPVCDECLRSLVGIENITLVPILNEAFCPTCGPARLLRVIDYPEDRPIRARREEFYKQFYGLDKQ